MSAVTWLRIALISVLESALDFLKSFETHRLEPATPSPTTSTTADKISAIVPKRIEKPFFAVSPVPPGIPVFICWSPTPSDAQRSPSANEVAPTGGGAGAGRDPRAAS